MPLRSNMRRRRRTNIQIHAIYFCFTFFKMLKNRVTLKLSEPIAFTSYSHSPSSRQRQEISNSTGSTNDLHLMHNSDDTMKSSKVLSSFLVVWTLTEFVCCAEDIQVKTGPAEITITCGGNKFVSKDGERVKFPLKYKDDNSGEYKCVDEMGQPSGQEIFVKFRSCDNCVEFDLVSISGLAVGDLIATIVLGVAVYLVASQTHASVIASPHRNTDGKHLNPNETQKRVPNDNYQELRYKDGRREIYGTLLDK